MSHDPEEVREHFPQLARKLGRPFDPSEQLPPESVDADPTIDGSQPRICLRCAHCRLDAGFAGSDVTPPMGGSWTCGRGHWDLSGGDLFDRADVLVSLEMAARCPDYAAISPRGCPPTRHDPSA